MTAEEAKAIEIAVQRGVEAAFEPLIRWAQRQDHGLSFELRNSVGDVARQVRLQLKKVAEGQG